MSPLISLFLKVLEMKHFYSWVQLFSPMGSVDTTGWGPGYCSRDTKPQQACRRLCCCRASPRAGCFTHQKPPVGRGGDSGRIRRRRVAPSHLLEAQSGDRGSSGRTWARCSKAPARGTDGSRVRLQGRRKWWDQQALPRVFFFCHCRGARPPWSTPLSSEHAIEQPMMRYPEAIILAGPALDPPRVKPVRSSRWAHDARPLTGTLPASAFWAA